MGKKSSQKSAKTSFLYSHEYRDEKIGGKTHETIFPETNEYCEKKMLGKNCLEKVRKYISYIHTNIVTKKMDGGWKRAKQFFQNYTNSTSKKCWKKIVSKKCENTFFIFKRISYQKMGGKNARNNFSRNTRIVRAKNGKKIVAKKCENKFFIFTRIS